MKTFKEYFFTELFQSIPAIDTKSHWKVEDKGSSDDHPNIEIKEVFYYTEIKDKKGKPIIYEYTAFVASPVPGKQITQKDIMFAGRTLAENLPASEISFTTFNHPVHGKTLGMVGDANPVEVLNHALAFVKDLVDTYNLNYVMFSASSKKVVGGVPNQDDDTFYSDSRERVYDRLVQRFAAQLGFKYEKRNSKMSMGQNVHGSTDFILIRK